MTAHGDFLRRNSRSRDTDVAAVADNCRFDERAGTERWDRFDALLPDRAKLGGSIDWMDWIDYRRTHLYGLGTITRPHRLTHDQLRDARDLHLLALQVECGRDDFGETLKGRI